jgi:putative ABC transport system permease protein
MFLSALVLALREIRRNLMRSFLTVLGVVIGVAAVITMVTLGRGATRLISDQIAGLGSNLLMLHPGQHLGPGRDSAGAPPFKLADGDAILAQVPGIQVVAPEASSTVTLVAGDSNWATTVHGTTRDYLRAGNWKLAEGRTFLDEEERAGRAVCVIGATVRRELFGAANPLGSQIRIKNFSCEVVGLLAAKGQGAMGQDQDDTVLVPLGTVQRRLLGSQDVPAMLISLGDGVDSTAAMARITALLRERRKLAPGDLDNFSIMDTKEIAQTLSGTIATMTGLLGAVAAVSLLVGGIGIMNIMLVSVTERTREIGLRLAIGAVEREVLLQFLVEAGALSTLGGLAGMVLALGICLALAALMKIPFLFQPGINLLAFLFSAAIGAGFGLMPARRAARLDPIEALRHE